MASYIDFMGLLRVHSPLKHKAGVVPRYTRVKHRKMIKHGKPFLEVVKDIDKRRRDLDNVFLDSKTIGISKKGLLGRKRIQKKRFVLKSEYLGALDAKKFIPYAKEMLGENPYFELVNLKTKIIVNDSALDKSYVVQPYYDRPSLNMLMKYADRGGLGLSEIEREKCEKFFDKNGFSPTRKVMREINETMQRIFNTALHSGLTSIFVDKWIAANALVLGVNPKNGKLKIGIIDL